MFSRASLLVRALVVGSMTMTLACGGGEQDPPVTPLPDAGPPAPPDGKVAHFLPVQVLSTHPDSMVRWVAKPRSSTGVVIMRDEKAGMTGEVLFRPEAWFDLDDGTMVHMTTDGSGRDPSVTTFERMGESIRLELVDGVNRAVYIDASGKRTTFTDPGGAAMQPLMDESPESAVDRTLKWFMSCRHHPVVDKAWQTVEKLNMWARSLETGFEDAQQALEKAHKVFVKEPIAAELTEPPSEYRATLMLRELNTKALARPSVDNNLPPQPYVRDEATQELVPAASYAPPRVPCVREYKFGGELLAMIRSTCAATTEDCQAADGTAFERRADCEGWCARQAEPKAVLASFDPAKHQLSCYQQQCNDELDDLSFQPVMNEKACALGCAPELCGGETGACEIPTENSQGQHYTVCKENLNKGFCEAGPAAEAFVPGKKCSDVGYPYWNAGEGVWRMTPPTTYDAGPKLDGPKADAGAGTDAPRTDAGAGTDGPRTDGGTTTPTKVCNGRFEILEVGTPKPAVACGRYSTDCNGSGRVYDTSTRLTWSRNELAAVFRSDFTGAASACSKIGMRLPTMPELKAVAPVICKDAVHWGASPYMTSTDHPDPDPAWHYCVTYPTGKDDYCINYVGLVCVK